MSINDALCKTNQEFSAEAITPYKPTTTVHLSHNIYPLWTGPFTVLCPRKVKIVLFTMENDSCYFDLSQPTCDGEHTMEYLCRLYNFLSAVQLRYLIFSIQQSDEIFISIWSVEPLLWHITSAGTDSAASAATLA